ncbi:MAG: hypothetical protein ACLVGK_10470, partial [Pilosibacter sp.]
SSPMLCPIGQSNEKPPLQVLAKWREYVTEKISNTGLDISAVRAIIYIYPVWVYVNRKERQIWNSIQ